MAKTARRRPSSKVTAAATAGALAATAIAAVDQLFGWNLSETLDYAIIVLAAFAAGWARPERRIAPSALETMLELARLDMTRTVGDAQSQALDAVAWIRGRLARLTAGAG